MNVQQTVNYNNKQLNLFKKKTRKEKLGQIGMVVFATLVLTSSWKKKKKNLAVIHSFCAKFIQTDFSEKLRESHCGEYYMAGGGL